MFDVQALREKHGTLIDQATAISNIIKNENREPTESEKSALDSILDTKIPEVKAEIARAEKYEAEITALAASRIDNGPEIDSPGTPVNSSVITVQSELPLSHRISIPSASLFHMRKIVAFDGPKAKEEAYVAGRFFMAAIGNHAQSQQWCRDNSLEYRPRAALTTGDNTLGGVLVPSELEQRIILLREERGTFSAYARLERMASDTKIIPRHVSGPTAYYLGDNDTITPSDIKHDNIELVAKKLAALVLASSELSEDAFIDLGDMITMHIAYKFADAEDEAGFNGDGTSTYGGMVGLKNALAAGSVSEALSGNTSFGELDLVDFEAMIGKLPTFADDGSARWYIHRAGWAASMANLANAAGGNTTETIAAGPSQRMFMGYPVTFVNVMNSTLTAQTSTAGLVYFGNLSQAAAYGLRRGITLAMSDQRYFELDQLAFRGTQRYVINVHERGTATVAGPIVRLDTPSS